MNINEIQKKIAELDAKFRLLDINVYYDKDYNYRIKRNSYDVMIKFINDKSDVKIEELIENSLNNILYISLCDKIKFTNINIISGSDIDKLLRIKNECNSTDFDKICEYLLFNRSNDSFFDMVWAIYEKHNIIERKNVVKEEKKESINVIEILKTEFKNKYMFTKQKNYYISSDGSVAILFMHSKRHSHISYKYWYTFHTYQKNELDKYKDSYVILYFDDIDQYTLINTNKLYPYLGKLGKTEHGDNIGWHLHIQEKKGIYSIRIPKEGLLNINESKNEQEDKIDLEKNERNMTTIKISLKDYKIIKFK